MAGRPEQGDSELARQAEQLHRIAEQLAAGVFRLVIVSTVSKNGDTQHLTLRANPTQGI